MKRKEEANMNRIGQITQFWIGLAALLIITSAGVPCANADMCCEDTSNEWKIKFMPYGWFAGADGDITARGVTRSFDTDFDDIFDKLNIGFMGRTEAWRNRWGITSEIIYMDLEAERSVGGVNLDAGLEQFMLEFGGAYKLGKWELGHAREGQWHRHISAAALAGGRYVHTETEFQVELPAGVTLSDEDDWVAPYIGGRIKLDVSERIGFFIMGDVGGFGVGAADLTGNLITGLGYEISDRFSAKAGYRWFWIDQDIADITISGPVLGMGIRF